MLSLDATGMLVQELDLAEFYSSEIRYCARRAIDNTDANRSESQWLDGVFDFNSCKLLEDVAEVKGKQTADALQSWVDWLLHLGAEQEGRLFIWRLKLSRLVHAWSNCDQGCSTLPLHTADETTLRIAVRDHISHCQNVEKEMYRLTFLAQSEWDLSIDNAQVGHWSHDTLNAEFTTRSAYIFWRWLMPQLSDAQKDALSAWEDYNVLPVIA